VPAAPAHSTSGIWRSQAQLTPPLATRAPRTNEGLLLVIEDDPSVAAALGEIIRGQGLECLIATDGASGLRLAGERRPVGIILDVKLPDVDGWAVMAALRAHPVTARIPVHVVSAANAAERALALGAVGYLPKPASPADLRRVIDSLNVRGVCSSSRTTC
jgi:CheY-like chemotaxis protein